MVIEIIILITRGNNIVNIVDFDIQEFPRKKSREVSKQNLQVKIK